LPSDEELEELKPGESGDQNFSSKVLQRRWEFFDSKRNFLYRILPTPSLWRCHVKNSWASIFGATRISAYDSRK
jgi:hypothetical protein